MSRKLLFLICLGYLSLILSEVSHANDLLSNSPKFGFRFSNGYLANAGSSTPSSFLIGGLNPQVVLYPTPQLGLALGYWADIDFAGNAVLISGWDVSGRWYFVGQGTRTRQESSDLAIERDDKLRVYFGGEFSERSYFIGKISTEPGIESTGKYFCINGLIGSEYVLSRHFELTTEFNLGLLPFAASDPNYRVRGILLNIGINYIW